MYPEGVIAELRALGRDAIDLLLWIGFVRRRLDGTLRFPVHLAPAHFWWFLLRRGGGPFPRFGIFRNRPEVIKWLPGRLLPRRWGFFVLGLEVGDRG